MYLKGLATVPSREGSIWFFYSLLLKLFFVLFFLTLRENCIHARAPQGHKRFYLNKGYCCSSTMTVPQHSLKPTNQEYLYTHLNIVYFETTQK